MPNRQFRHAATHASKGLCIFRALANLQQMQFIPNEVARPIWK